MKMADLRITCINKQDRHDPFDRILYVGGGATLLGSWRKSQSDVIHEIESRINTFYVMSGPYRADVIVRVSRFDNKYITTEPDGENQNNLLSLPECSG